MNASSGAEVRKGRHAHKAASSISPAEPQDLDTLMARLTAVAATGAASADDWTAAAEARANMVFGAPDEGPVGGEDGATDHPPVSSFASWLASPRDEHRNRQRWFYALTMVAMAAFLFAVLTVLDRFDFRAALIPAP
jgi:hypothetical protein